MTASYRLGGIGNVIGHMCTETKYNRSRRWQHSYVPVQIIFSITDMLQSIRTRLGLVSVSQDSPAYHVIFADMNPPRLLVSVHISSPTLPLSTADILPVVITLGAQVEAMKPMTVCIGGSILDSRHLAVFAMKSSFKAKRLSVDLCNFSSNVDPGIQEIPAEMSSCPPYQVQHRLYTATWMTPCEVGFEVGHTYEVGFAG